MDLKKKVWSFSSVKSFEQCPYSFYLHYVEGEQELPNAFAQSGSFVHSILERCYKGELYEFELADEFEAHYSEQVTERFPFYNMAKSYYDTSLAYLQTFEKDDNYEVLGVEKRINCEIGGHKFTGIIDLLLRDKSDGRIIIQDHKSKSAFKKGEKADYAKQLYIYSKAVYEEYGEFPKELWFNLYRTQKIEKVEFKEGDYTAALDWFKVAVDMILQEQEWECKPDSWYCANLCGFTDCVYNGGGIEMGAFKIGDKFGSIEEYCNYPYSHLFFYDKVIGKAITDNWQFRQIENGIKYGYLRKAELNNGYKLYEVTALVFDNYSYATKPFISKARFVAKSADEAEKKMIKYRYSGVFADNHGEHEYEYNDGSGIVKFKVVECNG